MFCSKCGKQIDVGPEFCTHCGAKVAQAASSKPKKSNKTKFIIIGVVGAFLALIAIGAIVNSFSGEGGSSNTSGLPQNLEVGQSAQTSEQKVTVLSADRDLQSQYCWQPNTCVITVNAQVENIGAGSLYVMISNFSLSDSEGNRYDNMVFAGDSVATMKEIYQGEKTGGNIRFAVPTSATGLKLAYNFATLGDPLLARWRLD